MISVIIPTYNPKEYFYDCLDSLKNQTLSQKKYSIYLVFNNTSKEVINHFTEYCRNIDLSVVILDIELAGVSRARNLGLISSNDEYICFLDDDDIISSNYLENLLALADNETIVISNVMAFKEKGNYYKYGQTFNSDLMQNNALSSKKNLSTVWGKLIPRNVILDSKFDEKLKNGEDAIFIFEILKNNVKIKHTNVDTFYFRRMRLDSAFYSKKSKFYYLSNTFYLIFSYAKIFFKNPFHFKFIFFVNRIFAVLKKLFIDIGLWK